MRNILLTIVLAAVCAAVFSMTQSGNTLTLSLHEAVTCADAEGCVLIPRDKFKILLLLTQGCLEQQCLKSRAEDGAE